MKRLVPLVLLSVLTACGSTVPLTSQSQLGGTSGDGLSAEPVASGPGTSVPGVTTPGAEPGVTTGAGGAGSVPGATTGGGATSGSQSPSTSAPGSSAPVVTGGGGAPVEIGFFVTKDLGPATKALGYDGLATGNGATHAKASAALLNTRGGLAGHKVVPVVFEYDATGDQNNQFQAACGLFFDDHKVRAVVSVLLLPAVRACAGKRGVPFVTSGNRTTSQAEIARYPLTALPPQLSLERTVASWLPSLKEQGWFTAGSKIGLLYQEEPDYAGAPGLVEKGLKELGLVLTDKQAMPSSDDTSRVGAASSAGQNAALRFASRGIDRVLTLDKSGQALTYFALAAGPQGYYPAYGLTSLSLPGLLRTVLSARQLENARGIGWSPGVDVPASAQPKPGVNAALCLDAMRKAGEDMNSSGTRFSALAVCDGVLVLAGAWKNDPQLAPSTFLPGLRALGKSYSAVLSFGADFSQHVDGSSQYRAIAFDAGRDSFVYSGPLQPAR